MLNKFNFLRILIIYSLLGYLMELKRNILDAIVHIILTTVIKSFSTIAPCIIRNTRSYYYDLALPNLL